MEEIKPMEKFQYEEAVQYIQSHYLMHLELLKDYIYSHPPK